MNYKFFLGISIFDLSYWFILIVFDEFKFNIEEIFKSKLGISGIWSKILFLGWSCFSVGTISPISSSNNFYIAFSSVNLTFDEHAFFYIEKIIINLQFNLWKV